MHLAFAVEMLAPPPVAQSQTSAALIVEGAVCDASGKPVANAEVRLEASGKPAVVTQSDANGVFRLSAPDSGPYTISADKSGERSLPSTVASAHTGARKHIDLVLDGKRTASTGNAASAPSSVSPMEFADQPNFTVAGVTDWTAAGGHGSDSILRTSEALARETLTLKAPGAAPVGNHKTDLEQAREQVRQRLAQAGSAALHRQLAELDEELGDPLSAVREYEQAARLDPSEPNYFEWGSELLLHRAVWQAAEVFGSAAQAYPKSARMLAALGAALFAGARYDEAAQRLCEASELAPADPAPYLFMGKIEMAAPSPLPCVEERLARFARQEPDNALANYFYAMALWKRQELPPDAHDMQHVEALLNNAVTIDKKCADAYLQLGLIDFSRHDYKKAIAHYTQAIAANPQLGEAHYRLGVAYDRIGEAGKANEEFQLHGQIEQAQAEAIERQRREVKQFLVVLQGPPASPLVH